MISDAHIAKRRWPCCPSASSQSISRSDLRRAKTFSLNSWVLSEFIALTLATQLGLFDSFDGISFISIAMPRGGITWLVSSSNTSRAVLILPAHSPCQKSAAERHSAVDHSGQSPCQNPEPLWRPFAFGAGPGLAASKSTLRREIKCSRMGKNLPCPTEPLVANAKNRHMNPM
jgi:hypothetical protein